MIELTLAIEIAENFDAEDALSNALQDEGLQADLIESPVRHEIWSYLVEDYGKLLNIDVWVREVK